MCNTKLHQVPSHFMESQGTPGNPMDPIVVGSKPAQATQPPDELCLAFSANFMLILRHVRATYFFISIRKVQRATKKVNAGIVLF